MSKNKDGLIIDVTKDKADLFLKIWVTPEIEEFFKTMAVQECGAEESKYTQVSSKWFDEKNHGLKFYKNNSELQTSIGKYMNNKFLVGTSQERHLITVVNDFGKSLFDNNQLNIAPLRVVGVSKDKGITFKTTDLIAYEEMKRYVEELAVFFKNFYGSFLKKQEIKAKVQFEV